MQTTGDGPDVDYKSLYEQEQLKNLSLIKEINKLKQVVEKYESNQSQEATYNKFFISDPSVNEEYESLLLKYENWYAFILFFSFIYCLMRLWLIQTG